MPNEINNKLELIKLVLGPIVFLDLFDYSPNANEIWRFIDKKISLSEVYNIVGALIGEQRVVYERNGFYFLPGREKNIEIRQKRYNYSVKKIKIAKKFSRFFSFLPAVKMIAVANFIGDHNLREEGDIDFFIITSKNRIWLSRLFCAGFAKLLNSRPTARKKQDKICLSFYISEDHLDVSDLSLPIPDPYFHYWLRGLMPIYDKDNTYQQFLAANRITLDNDNALTPRKYKSNNILEKIAKSIQLKIMSPALREAMVGSEGVLISDNVLKLYLKDRRRYFAEKYNLKIDEIVQKIN